jgi:hypothetical protein
MSVYVDIFDLTIYQQIKSAPINKSLNNFYIYY